MNTSRGKSIIIAFFIGYTAAILIGATLGMVGVYYAKRVEEESSRYSYARGLYDTCVAVGVNYFNAPLLEARVQCLQSISSAMASGEYYEAPSEGFIWPLPTPTLTGEGG